VKGYSLWDPTSWKIIISRDVIFDEYSFFKSNVERIQQEQISPNQQIQLEGRLFGAVKRKKRLLEKKVLKIQRKLLMFLNKFSNQSL